MPILLIAPLLFLVIIFVVFAISTLAGIPCMPTHRRQVITMMDLAKIRPGMQVVDLGSGWGTLLFAAANRGAIAVGYEINPLLCWYTKIIAAWRGQSDTVRVKCQTLYQADISRADVVLSFLFPKPMQKLEQKLFHEMKPGSTILSYVFSIPGHTPSQKKEGIYVYPVD